MLTFTIEVKQQTIFLRLGKLKGARKFLYAPNMEFYIQGKVQHRRDICVNVAINKAIEAGLKATDVRWWDYIK